jgi:solute carrier family 25 (peroxisomal adenine nucleotide transporter), member 17
VFAVSAASKLGATVVTYPLLLVKARLQAAGARTSADRVYAGTADAVARIWAEGGLRAFYAGLRPKIVQSVLAAALMMATKEEISAGVRAALAPRPAAVPGPRAMTSPARAAVLVAAAAKG